jgi:toxin YoeB
MKKYTVDYSSEADEDLLRHKSAGSKQILQKIKDLVDELEVHPEMGTGKPKKLKHQSIEVWTRDINKKHRMEYIIKEDELVVLILFCYGHYDDK